MCARSSLRCTRDCVSGPLRLFFDCSLLNILMLIPFSAQGNIPKSRTKIAQRVHDRLSSCISSSSRRRHGKVYGWMEPYNIK